MVSVAEEMERRGLQLPLLIGGATTSKQHTAVRVAPAYTAPVVHVLDASRVVNVVSDLLDTERRPEFVARNLELQETLRQQHADKQRKPLLTLDAARENRLQLQFDDLPVPSFTGVREVQPPLETLRDYIDWTFFFHAWELRGKFPDLLSHPEHGAAASELHEHALAELDAICRGQSLVARGVYGFWPARSESDDIVVRRNGSEVRFPMLRQQVDHGDPAIPNRSLADFVAPAAGRAQGASEQDHIGGFAVSIHGADELARKFEQAGDDYRAIIVKALADRLAEAFAEYLHEVARREWYETGSELSKDDLIAEKYRGIRPAYGYPACPDHSEKARLFNLLGAERAGMSLTESYAMLPGAAVSGLYFAHPQAKYFNVGKIGRDQLQDYAGRKGVPVDEAQRWLRPILGFE
jgi:5-methyltetrahydrofolate--homocysteine methyltransferase